MAEQRIYQGHVYTRNGPGEAWVIAGPAPGGGSIIVDPYKATEESRKNEDQAMERERLRLAREAAAHAAHADARAEAEFNAKNNPAPAPGDTTKTGEDYLATLSPALAAQVKALADGRRAFPTGAALRSPQVQELVAAATQYDPTLDAANAATRVATRKDFTSGKAAQNITAMNTALGHLGTLSNAAKGLENRSFPLWNTLANAGEQAIGDPRVKNFTLARDAVANELMKVFRGTGGSLAEIEEWKHNIDSSDSPEQLHAAITQATELLHSRLDAMNDQYSRGMNKSGDPIQLLSPHAQQIYQKITGTAGLGIGGTGGGSGGSGGGGGGGNSPHTPWTDPSNQGSPADTAASGATRAVHLPRMNAQVNAMINGGASEAQINAVLAQHGLNPLVPGRLALAQKWMKDHPGTAFAGANITREEPLTVMQKVSGSAPGAMAANMANTFTAGTVEALAGDKGKGALDAMGAMHPDASVTGSLIGGVTGAAGLEAGLAARAPAAVAKYVPRVADALYGGVGGFNSAPEGQGAGRAVVGALAGTLGGAVGEKAMQGVGAAFRGVRDPAVEYLQAAGVPLTVGQILARGGWVGRGVKKVEDALTSVPFVGNLVEARRREGLQGFNRAAFDIGAQTAGGQVQDYGSAGIRQLEALKNQAYDRALAPVRIDANEPQFVSDLGDVVTAANAIPNVNGAQDAARLGLSSRFDGAIDPTTGIMDGGGFQEVYRGLARTGRERANGDYGHEVGQVMRQGQDALVGALERQQPGAYPAFVDANTAHRRLNVLADAVGKAKNQEDEIFFPSQLNAADASSATKLTGRIASAGGERPFYDLANAGQAVLPSKLPDSGTATREAVIRGLTGVGLLGATTGAGYASGDAAAGTEAGVAATLALALGGTKGGQALAAWVLTHRPDLAVRIGEGFQRHARIGGSVGTGLAMSEILGMGGP